MPKKSSEFRLRPNLNLEQMSVSFDVVDSDDVVQDSVGPFLFSALVEDFQKRTSLHGVSTLLQQRTSGIKIEAGKLEAMTAYWDLLLNGEWAKERVGGPGVVSAEVEAIARIKKCSIPQAQKALKALNEETRKKVLESADVVKMAATIKQEREAAKDVDLGDLA